jgi:hypothetical protein
MPNKTGLAIFENFEIRRQYDEKTERWYFSVVDIIRALLEQPDFQTARKYWNKLKERLGNEKSEAVTNCHRLKMLAQDGKMRETDTADTETIFRLIQSVPSPKVEPIKLWLAKVGYERIEEINDPEKLLNRARENWEKHGRSQKWIQQRMMGQETRNKLTDYWSEHGISEKDEFAILTNIIHKEWSDLTVGQHKKLKNLKTQNLRDHMSEVELIFTALAEVSTRQIATALSAEGLAQNKIASQSGGAVAKKARIDLEKKTGQKVVSRNNFLSQKKDSVLLA